MANSDIPKAKRVFITRAVLRAGVDRNYKDEREIRKCFIIINASLCIWSHLYVPIQCLPLISSHRTYTLSPLLPSPPPLRLQDPVVEEPFVVVLADHNPVGELSALQRFVRRCSRHSIGKSYVN